MKPKTDENPRWTACQLSIGRRPKGYEFICWIGRRWIEFAKTLGGRDSYDVHRTFGEASHARFDAWLFAGVDAGKWAAEGVRP